MCNQIGIKSTEELFEKIPKNVRMPKLDLPDGLSEMEAQRIVKGISVDRIPQHTEDSRDNPEQLHIPCHWFPNGDHKLLPKHRHGKGKYSAFVDASDDFPLARTYHPADVFPTQRHLVCHSSFRLALVNTDSSRVLHLPK